jgi:hypothetical protein
MTWSRWWERGIGCASNEGQCYYPGAGALPCTSPNEWQRRGAISCNRPLRRVLCRRPGSARVRELLLFATVIRASAWLDVLKILLRSGPLAAMRELLSSGRR